MIHFISYPQTSGYSKETFNIHQELISTMFIWITEYSKKADGRFKLFS